MQTKDFDYDLPPDLIAQTPCEPRDASRLMVLNRTEKTISHDQFSRLSNYLNPGDLLVINDSRVLPARLYGSKEGTGGAMEILLLAQKEKDVWEILAKPGKRAKEGVRYLFGGGLLVGEITQVLDHGNRLMRFFYEGDTIYPILERIGEMPLPPYIKERLVEQERYQTVYAKDMGSAAAPTAGLHFTKRLMDELEAKGVEFARVTLHVGLGTFRPVQVDTIEAHKMHAEHYLLDQVAADQIHAAKSRGSRVIAVGTTSCRTLESVALHHGKIVPAEGYTDIFLFPGKKFQVLDGLITNFHLPESTLIMLVSAFAGTEFTKAAYQTAIDEKYRFFSFGDAMLIS